MSTRYLDILPPLPALPNVALDRILTAALAGLAPNSCRVYTRHLTLFLSWLSEHQSQLHREAVTVYLDAAHKGNTSSYNQALSAIKRLASQCAEHNWISWHIARAIEGIPARVQRGATTGNWLTLDQTRTLLSLPPRTLSGRRDKAVLALLLGCGLRRAEAAALCLRQIQIRDNRTMLCDIRGKGNRIRTIAVPEWATALIRDWWIEGDLSDGRLLRSFTSDGRVNGTLSVSAIWDIVQHYAELAHVTCTPHDLRRTYAKLARKAGAPLEIIQKSLGHASVTTTEKYTNTGEESNAGDYIKL